MTNTTRGPRRRLLFTTVGAALFATAGGTLFTSRPAFAHDFRVGELAVDHPYALPTPTGAKTGAVYFRGIRNRGRKADRLIAASTDRAAAIEIHQTVTDNGVARMREVPGIALPAGRTTQLRHGQQYHLMLIDLKTPLVVGQRFDLTLRFEQAGEVTVQAWVQQPRGGAATAPDPAHDHGAHGDHRH